MKSFLFRYELKVVVRAPSVFKAWDKFDKTFPSLVKDRFGGVTEATPMTSIKRVVVK